MVEVGACLHGLRPEGRLDAEHVALRDAVDLRGGIPLVRVSHAGRPGPGKSDRRAARVLHVEVGLRRRRHDQPGSLRDAPARELGAPPSAARSRYGGDSRARPPPRRSSASRGAARCAVPGRRSTRSHRGRSSAPRPRRRGGTAAGVSFESSRTTSSTNAYVSSLADAERAEADLDAGVRRRSAAVAGQTAVRRERGVHVPRHVDLGDDLDEPLPRVGDEFATEPRSDVMSWNAPAAMYFVISVLPISITSGAFPPASIASNLWRWFPHVWNRRTPTRTTGRRS